MKTNERRVKKLEDRVSINKNLIEKIIVEYINPDGSVNSTMVKELINGVWCMQTQDIKSTN